MNEIGISFGCESIEVTKYKISAYSYIKWKHNIVDIESWLNRATNIYSIDIPINFY